MTKLAPILKEISKNVRVGGYDGSRSHDRKLHETFALSRRSGRGPKSIIWTPAMAKHNNRVLILSCSQRKRLDFGLLPAIERYDGGHFRVLRKARREGYWPEAMDVLILS